MQLSHLHFLRGVLERTILRIPLVPPTTRDDARFRRAYVRRRVVKVELLLDVALPPVHLGNDGRKVNTSRRGGRTQKVVREYTATAISSVDRRRGGPRRRVDRRGRGERVVGRVLLGGRFEAPADVDLHVGPVRSHGNTGRVHVGRVVGGVAGRFRRARRLQAVEGVFAALEGGGVLLVHDGRRWFPSRGSSDCFHGSFSFS